MAAIIDGIVFVAYFTSISAILRNSIRIKLQNDFEAELKGLREYDLSTDCLNPDKLLKANPDGGKFIVLCNLKAGEEKRPFIHKTILSSNKIDIKDHLTSTMHKYDENLYFSCKPEEPFTLEIKEEV